MKRQSSRPNCLRTGSDEIMNANYDLGESIDPSLDKTRAL